MAPVDASAPAASAIPILRSMRFPLWMVLWGQSISEQAAGHGTKNGLCGLCDKCAHARASARLQDKRTPVGGSGTPAHIEAWSARGRAGPGPRSRQGKAPDATAAPEALMKPNDPKRAYFFAALTGSLTPSTVSNSTL